MNKNTQNYKNQHRINLGVYKNLCSKLQANLYLQGIRMKNEMMEDYSVTCTLGRYRVWASLLSPLSCQSAERQGAALQPLKCVWIPSLLRSIIPQTWVFNHTGEHEFTSPGTDFMVQKKHLHLSAGKSLCKFPFWLGRKERFLRGQCRAKV